MTAPSASANEPNVLKSVYRFAVWSLKALHWIYFASLLVLLMALDRRGERMPILGVLLFAPPTIFLLPFAFITPLSALLCRKLILWQLLAGLIVCLIYTPYRLSSGGNPSQETITVVTHNAGQGNRQQFTDFLAAENPDVILLQDARTRAADFTARFPDRYVTSRGEFLVVSRYLIQQAALLPEPRWRGRAIAARFEIIVQGKPIAFYSVHMPTPRSQLSKFLGAGVVKEFFNTDEEPADPRTGPQWLSARAELAESFAKVLEKEKQPFIVGGDFNMPDHGESYHILTGILTDAFAHSGHGWGLTFPGSSRNPLSFFRPWLRIDFLFAGAGWNPISCKPEAGRRSQHCAVVARFNPLTKKSS